MIEYLYTTTLFFLFKWRIYIDCSAAWLVGWRMSSIVSDVEIRRHKKTIEQIFDYFKKREEESKG